MTLYVGDHDKTVRFTVVTGGEPSGLQATAARVFVTHPGTGAIAEWLDPGLNDGASDDQVSFDYYLQIGDIPTAGRYNIRLWLFHNQTLIADTDKMSLYVEETPLPQTLID